MLTERDLQSIRKRHEAFQSGRGRIAAILSAQDVPALLAEHERVCEQLAMAWIVLDGIARLAGACEIGETAADLLRGQGAPGWKK